MRRFICTLSALLWLVLPASAQIDTVWTRILPDYEGSSYELTCGIGLPGGGFLLCGNIYHFETDQNMLAVRTDSEGNILWMRDYQAMDVEDPWDIILADDGTVRVFGTQYSFNLPITNIFVSALTLDGDSLWTSYFATNDLYGSRGATILSDGSYMIAADTLDGEYFRRAMLIKIDGSGNRLWSRIYDFGENTCGRKVIESGDGTLLMAGDVVEGMIGQASVFLMRLDGQGNVLWDETYPIQNSFGTETTSLAENEAGDIFITASVLGISWWPGSAVLKYDASGDLLWAESVGTEIGTEFSGLVPEVAGGCMAVGRCILDFNGYYSPIIQLYDLTGTVTDTWQNGMEDWGLAGICPVTSGGSLAFGWANIDLGQHRGYLVSIGDPTELTGLITHLEDDQPLEGIRVALSPMVYTYTDTEGRYSLITSQDTVDVLVSDACINSVFIEDFVLDYGEVNTLNIEVTIPEYTREPSSVNLAIRYNVEVTETVTLHNPGSGPLDFTAEVISALPDYNWLTVSPAEGTVPVGQSTQLTLSILADSEQSTDTDYFGTVRVRNHSCPDSIDDIPVSAVALGLSEPQEMNVSEYALYPAYPNPFNAVTNLNFEIASPGIVFVNLFDIQGRNTKTITSEYYPTGAHSLHLDLSDQPSGIYFVQLRCNEFTASQKLVLIK